MHKSKNNILKVKKNIHINLHSLPKKHTLQPQQQLSSTHNKITPTKRKASSSKKSIPNNCFFNGSKSTLQSHTNNNANFKTKLKKGKMKKKPRDKIKDRDKSKNKLAKNKNKENIQHSAYHNSKKDIKKMEELTQRKNKHLQYFMYRDVYLPIQNTQQRKIVYKIRLIDQSVGTVQDGKNNRANNNVNVDTNVNKRNNMRNKSTSIPRITFVDRQTQRTDRKLLNNDFYCQTQEQAQEDQNQNKDEDSDQDSDQCKDEKQQMNKIQETQIPNNKVDTYKNDKVIESEKKFAETLSQLQFLYLPDQKNFQGFSKTQKAHYKQLLLFIAKKFDESQSQGQNATISQQTIQLIMKQRQLNQKGLGVGYQSRGLPTHTPSIISYISNLFCYIQVHEKTYFIQRMNCSYGYQLSQKLNRVKQSKTTKRPANIISQNTFWRFQSQLHEGLQFQSQVLENVLHAHNRAIFDTVNEVLLQFQPYYSSQGEPFPWSYNFQTTFFLISQQNFQALANQVKQKIWQYSNTLAGLIIQTQSQKSKRKGGQGQQRYNIHIKKLLCLQQDLIRKQVKKIDERAELDEKRTEMMCQLSDLIQEQIIRQMVFLLCP